MSQTRLAKLAAGEADATLLAAAGLDRLGHRRVGAIRSTRCCRRRRRARSASRYRATRGDLRALLAAIDHRPTNDAVTAERAFLAALGGDCHSAVAALADGGRVKAEILSADGSEVRAGEGAPAELARQLLAAASPALRAMFAR